ncbi:hypothetical protein ABZX85_27770 [Streptomyces sp. NPDC004539]|uniref:hypothetical protein n=1 Tax=Streptomyces sp. NPDC004539 TaxID=3154280 RepID=UPI0033A13F82
MKKSWLILALGALLILFGVVWTLQGIDVMKGSAMSGTTTWAVLGPIVALAGVVLVGVGIARHRRISR